MEESIFDERQYFLMQKKAIELAKMQASRRSPTITDVRAIITLLSPLPDSSDGRVVPDVAVPSGELEVGSEGPVVGGAAVGVLGTVGVPEDREKTGRA
jgi:hypothetical protein